MKTSMIKSAGLMLALAAGVALSGCA